MLVGLILLGAVLTACSSSGPKAATTTTAAASGGSLSSKLDALSSSLQNAETATFKAVYKITTGGTTQTVTIEQAPPKSSSFR